MSQLSAGMNIYIGRLPTLRGRRTEHVAAHETDAVPDLQELWVTERDRHFTRPGTSAHSFRYALTIHSFTQQACVHNLMCARHSPRSWGLRTYL